jgi:ankyrin repeat protein
MGFSEHFQYVFGLGAELNAKDNDGRAALNSSTSNTHKNLVPIFLDRGADVNAVDNHGYTALHIAAIMLLLNWGYDIRANDEGAMKPLHHAAEDHSFLVYRY